MCLSVYYLVNRLTSGSGEYMKDIILLVFSERFIQLVIKSCITGLVIGFGAEIVLSLWGSAIFNLKKSLERSID